MTRDSRRRSFTRWHADPKALQRFVMALIEAEVNRLRPDGASFAAPPWDRTLRIDEQGLGLDSLERLSVASVLSEALHLHESGIEDLLLARRQIGEWVDIAHQGLLHFDTRLTFRTSGSSGKPTSFSHSLEELQQETTFFARLVSGSVRVLAAVPAHHIYGFLFTVMLPRHIRCTQVLDIRYATPQALQRNLRPGDLLVSHPAHWEMMAKYATAIPPGVTGVTSTAACPDRTARALAMNGLSRLLQIYGSSDTGGIGWRDAPTAPYHLLPYWSRYLADDTRLARRVRGAQRRLHALPDHLAWSDDRSFTVRGRRDAAVQIGGTNVYPEAVRRVLLCHPQVADAAVRPMTPREGGRLKAFVVPKPDTDAAGLSTALMRWVNTKLAVPERPRSYTIGAALPVNNLGKLCDWSTSG
jgi:long-chain acyl-CoA synthetase